VWDAALQFSLVRDFPYYTLLERTNIIKEFLTLVRKDD